MRPTTHKQERQHCQSCEHTSLVTVSFQVYYQEDLITHWVCPHCGTGHLEVLFRGAKDHAPQTG